jgi:hypothetical protein
VVREHSSPARARGVAGTHVQAAALVEPDERRSRRVEAWQKRLSRRIARYPRAAVLPIR